MLRSRIARGFLWALLALMLQLAPGPAGSLRAQGTRKDDIVFNSRGVPLAGASVRVCAQPATGKPCTPLALIYSDPGLTQALPNPTTTDGLGNYFFYAAPGKYEIEISGPGITTKQIPDVVLPQDPSNPTFSGNVSAFSLNLSGNLTVNGNTTVAGNLASGTLNLANQSTPPGSAGAGTVNLYTKSADKRLYYKDDTGTEIGPLGPGSGAQTNAPNTFTAPQNIDADFRTKGPNPWMDITRFGGYAGAATPPTISCNTTSGSASLTCAGGTGDFVAGHGVAIPKAGPAPTVLTPNTPVGILSMNISSNVATIAMSAATTFTNGASVTVAGATDATLNGTYTGVSVINGNTFTAVVAHANCSPCSVGSAATVVAVTPAVVTPVGQTGGSTTWNYKVAARDFNGGLSAASAPMTTTTGMPTLGVQNYTIAANGCSWSNGVMTFTTTTPHNIPNQPNIEINIPRGSTGNSFIEGAFVTAGAPTATTVTVNMQTLDVNNQTCPSGGTLQVVARNLVQWTPQGYNALGWVVWRSQGAGPYSLVAILSGQDSAFIDWGLPAPLLSGSDAAYIPSTPNASPINGILATTISAISGTNVTLASAAGASVSSATVLHDNAPNILAACGSIGTGAGVDLYYPAPAIYVINSPLKLYTCPATQQRHIFAGLIEIGEPVIPKANTVFEGRTFGNFGQIAPFQTQPAANVVCLGNPCFLQTFFPAGGQSNDITYRDLLIQISQPYFSGIYLDQDTNGAGIVTTSLQNANIQGARGTIPLRMGSGFGFFATDGLIGITGLNGNDWGFPPAFLDTVNRGLGQNTQGLMYIGDVRRTNFAGGELLVDGAGGTPNTLFSTWNFYQNLMENGEYPLFHFNANLSSGISIVNPIYADPTGGLSTPMIELGNATISALTVHGQGLNMCATGTQPLFSGSTQVVDVYNEGCSYLGLKTYAARVNGSAAYSNTSLIGFGSAILGQGFTSSPAPTATVVSGSLAAGTYYYKIIPFDVNGNVGPFSAEVGPITVNGSQAINLSWSLQPGQVYTTICRSNSGPTIFSCAGSGAPGHKVAGTSFTDNEPQFNFFDSAAYASLNANGSAVPSATSSSISSNGIQTSGLQITGGGFTSTVNGSFTSNHAQTLPDVTGYIPVTGYINSAYDNANRANGAIGSNWTVTNNGINISSNNFVGTVTNTNDVAYWNANPFSVAQFSQATITALNGTTDFPGVAVLLSGSGSSTHGYNCIEDTANIFIQSIAGLTNTTLTSAATTGAPGDILRLETDGLGHLTCYKNGAVVLTATDTTYTSGAPGLFLFGTVATAKNWSGGNVHPLVQPDVEMDFTKVQHLNAGIAMGSETFTASPRSEQNVFLPGALTSTWTGATWTTDKAVTITRVQVQAKTAPAGCTTNAVVRLTDGTSPVNVTISAAANDSGSILQNYAAGAALQISVQTAAAGCATAPADANVVVQYRMQ